MKNTQTREAEWLNHPDVSGAAGGEGSVDSRSRRRQRGPDLVGGCAAWEEEERMNAGGGFVAGRSVLTV